LPQKRSRSDSECKNASAKTDLRAARISNPGLNVLHALLAMGLFMNPQALVIQTMRRLGGLRHIPRIRSIPLSPSILRLTGIGKK